MSTAVDPLQAPQRPRRRRIDGFDGRVSRDRLSTMLVLAALAHGLVLLGVTFTAPGSKGDTPRGLEVLLVAEDLPEARENDDAAYIAQRSQEGSGNTRDRLPAELPGAGHDPAAVDVHRDIEGTSVLQRQVLAHLLAHAVKGERRSGGEFFRHPMLGDPDR